MHIRQNEPGLPLYYQVAQSLRKRIEDGTFMEGQNIPPESELEKEFRVSRITIRKAVDNLVQDGLLQKFRGLGTVVTKNMIRDEVHNLEGFTEKMEKQGKKVSSTILSVDRLVPSHSILSFLRLPEGQEVLKISRLRNVDELPLALFHTFIPLWMGITEKEDFSHSLFDIYARHKINPNFSDRTIHAITVDHATALLLNMKDSLAALQMNYCTYDVGDRPIEYAEGIYRGDLYFYKMRVYRSFCDVAGGELHNVHKL